MYSSDGKLLWYRSQNFGNKTRLKRAIPWILQFEEEIDYLIIEGGGPLRKIWDTILERRNIEVMHIMAEEWRQDILLEREQRKGKQAKTKAVEYAKKVIEERCEKKVSPPNTDAAEAILIGLWGMQKLGWIKNAAGILR